MGVLKIFKLIFVQNHLSLDYEMNEATHEIKKLGGNNLLHAFKSYLAQVISLFFIARFLLTRIFCPAGPGPGPLRTRAESQRRMHSASVSVLGDQQTFVSVLSRKKRYQELSLVNCCMWRAGKWKGGRGRKF